MLQSVLSQCSAANDNVRPFIRPSQTTWWVQTLTTNVIAHVHTGTTQVLQTHTPCHCPPVLAHMPAAARWRHLTTARRALGWPAGVPRRRWPGAKQVPGESKHDGIMTDVPLPPLADLVLRSYPHAMGTTRGQTANKAWHIYATDFHFGGRLLLNDKRHAKNCRTYVHA